MRRNYKNFKKFREVPLLVMFLVLLVAAAVFLSIEAATKGAQLMYLEKEIAKVEKENKALTSSLVQDTSLTKIAQMAEELGMKRPKSIIYLNNKDTVAKLP